MSVVGIIIIVKDFFKMVLSGLHNNSIFWRVNYGNYN